MAVEFRLPDLGEGIREAEIVEWLVAEGDAVAEHQIILRVETDKALVEVPAPAAGRIGRIRHREGDTVEVGEVLVWILGAGESEDKAAPAAARKATPAERRQSTTVVGVLDDRVVDLPPPPAAPRGSSEHQVLATPAVRRLARDLGVAIEEIGGSGSGGRVTEADVREAAAEQAETPGHLEARDEYGAVERVALRGIRRTIARRLKMAVAHTALATHMDEIDVTALVAIGRGAANAQEAHAGVFAWIVKATARALQRHGRFNATLDDAHEEVLLKNYVHIGIAVDTADGLMVPVIRDADRKSIGDIAAEVESLAAAARRRAVDLGAVRGGTFSISNIGSIGGMFATPIPNYPEVAILATGRIAERLGRDQKGGIVSRQVLPVSLTFDHRVVDGADAARFVNTLAELLAEPQKLE